MTAFPLYYSNYLVRKKESFALIASKASDTGYSSITSNVNDARNASIALLCLLVDSRRLHTSLCQAVGVGQLIGWMVGPSSDSLVTHLHFQRFAARASAQSLVTN